MSSCGVVPAGSDGGWEFVIAGSVVDASADIYSSETGEWRTIGEDTNCFRLEIARTISRCHGNSGWPIRAPQLVAVAT